MSEKKKVACLTFCAFYAFCMCKIVFVKKIKKSKITPDNLIYYTTAIDIFKIQSFFISVSLYL